MKTRTAMITILVSSFLSQGGVAAEEEQINESEICKPQTNFSIDSVSDPKRLGWDKHKLDKGFKFFQSLESSSLVVIHKGMVVANWGPSSEKYIVQSVRKSFLNALIGIYVGEGHLALEDTLTDLEISDTDPEISDADKQATLKDLLMSRSSIFHPALYEAPSWKAMREGLAEEEKQKGENHYKPGEFWIYNNWDFNALGTIAEKAGGQKIGPAFKERVADPIGMEDFEVDDVLYLDRSSMVSNMRGTGSDHPAYLFKSSTRDMARFGYLYMNCGNWAGKQIVPEAWVKETILSAEYTGNELKEGYETHNHGMGLYGYLWWVNNGPKVRFPDLKTQKLVYFASGKGGVSIMVIPEYDLVIAHTVAIEGDVGFFSMAGRAMFGTPSVDLGDLQNLYNIILEANPDFEPVT